MEIKNINVLMVDDHPMTLEGYETSLRNIEERFKQYHFHIESASSYSSAIHAISHKYRFRPLDLAILDIGLKKQDGALPQSGEELGLLLRKDHPKSKIIVITGFDNSILLRNILDGIDPEGLIVKSDIRTQLFVDAIIDVMDNPPYYSQTVAKFLAKRKSRPYTLDHLDKLILYYISRGKLTKELPTLLPLTISAIETRKKRLKEIFKATDRNDIELLLRAKEQGYL